MAREIKTTEQYLGKLLKLIPSEIIAAYMVIQGFIPEDKTKWGLSAIALVLFIIPPLYLKFVQKVEKTAQIFVSTFSFIIWVYAIGGPFVFWNIHEAWIASAVLLLWTTFIPQFFKTPPAQQP
jgi:heme/copper-type cytochrome/quinol oxidase subunit 4